MMVHTAGGPINACRMNGVSDKAGRKSHCFLDFSLPTPSSFRVGPPAPESVVQKLFSQESGSWAEMGVPLSPCSMIKMALPQKASLEQQPFL